jgi:hypothetical protein
MCDTGKLKRGNHLAVGGFSGTSSVQLVPMPDIGRVSSASSCFESAVTRRVPSRLPVVGLLKFVTYPSWFATVEYLIAGSFGGPYLFVVMVWMIGFPIAAVGLWLHGRIKKPPQTS